MTSCIYMFLSIFINFCDFLFCLVVFVYFRDSVIPSLGKKIHNSVIFEHEFPCLRSLVITYFSTSFHKSGFSHFKVGYKIQLRQGKFQLFQLQINLNCF